MFGTLNEKTAPLAKRGCALVNFITRLLLFFSGRGGGFGGGRSGTGRIDPFEDRFFGGVALAAEQLDDAGVTAAAFFAGRRDFVKENLHGVFLVQASCGQTTGMDGAGFAEGHHLLRHRTRGLGLCEGGGDAFVFDQTTDEVGEHRIAMGAGASEFGCSFTMSHGADVLDPSRLVFFRKIKQRRIDIHSKAQAQRRELLLDFVQRFFAEVAIL